MTGAPLDADAKSQHSARFQACADLAFAGASTAWHLTLRVSTSPHPSTTDRPAKRWSQAVARKPPRKPANPGNPACRFQDEIRKPCLPFVVSKATNSTAWALHRLAGLARIAPTREHLQRAVAATLGLGSSDRGRLEGDEVVCGSRPHFGGVDVGSSRLAAVVLNEVPSKDESGSLKRMRMAMGRRLLALELGLVPSPGVPDEGSLSVDAGAGRASTVVVDAQSTLKAIRSGHSTRNRFMPRNEPPVAIAFLGHWGKALLPVDLSRSQECGGSRAEMAADKIIERRRQFLRYFCR